MYVCVKFRINVCFSVPIIFIFCHFIYLFYQCERISAEMSLVFNPVFAVLLMHSSYQAEMPLKVNLG